MSTLRRNTGLLYYSRHSALTRVSHVVKNIERMYANIERFSEIKLNEFNKVREIWVLLGFIQSVHDKYYNIIPHF